MKDALERCNNSIGEDSVGVRLVEKGKKGISHLLFGRSTIVVALIILQVYLFSAVLNWISRHTPHIIVITLIFLITLVIVIVNDNGDASAKVTWLLLMMLFPIPGGIFYIFTRTDLGHRMVKKRTLELRNITSNLLDYDEETLEKIKLEDIQSYELCKYINKHGKQKSRGHIRRHPQQVGSLLYEARKNRNHCYSSSPCSSCWVLLI